LPKSHLTAAAVARIKPPRTGQVDHFDAGYPGLALRISYGGSRTWVWFYRQDGKLRRLTLGALPKLGLADAREAWRVAREQVSKGLKPVPVVAAVPTPDDPTTVRRVAGDWLERDQATNRKHGTPARAYAEVERIMNREVLPEWGSRRITDITPQDVEDLIDAVVDRGAVTMACRVHARLHRLFRWAVQRRLIDASPMQDMPRPRAEIKRKRVLKDGELRVMWDAASQIGWPMGAAMQLLVLTCARREEIGALRWTEIDSGRTQILLQGDRTKNAEDRIIPLSSMARKLIEAIPRLAGCPFVFSTTTTTPISGWSKVKQRIDKMMQAELGEEFEPWRLHDLRRTTATGLERLGVPLPVTEALLGHTAGSKGGIAGIYQLHDYLDEKREAVEKWGQHVASLLGERVGRAK
jgi:integrase